MARSKHKTTGNGSHRERIFKARQAMIEYRRTAMKAEKDRIAQMAAVAAQPVDITINGDMNIMCLDPASPEGDNTVAVKVTDYMGENMVIKLPPAEPSVKDDGLGHSHEDENLQDTMRELNGMVANDKHEQLMDTFVEEKADAIQ